MPSATPRAQRWSAVPASSTAVDIERVFERFYRAVDVRSETGSGFGLSIVEEIARSHGGTVFARNRTGGGAEVGFALPGTRRLQPGNATSEPSVPHDAARFTVG